MSRQWQVTGDEYKAEYGFIYLFSFFKTPCNPFLIYNFNLDNVNPSFHDVPYATGNYKMAACYWAVQQKLPKMTLHSLTLFSALLLVEATCHILPPLPSPLMHSAHNIIQELSAPIQRILHIFGSKSRRKQLKRSRKQSVSPVLCAEDMQGRQSRKSARFSH